MAEITNYLLGFNPVWSMVDLDGKQFDDTFYMYVLTNTVPYIPAAVYHDPSGNIPWSYPIQFLSNGTLPIDIYWDTTQVYRLEIRKNITATPSQADQLIYLIENYVPGENDETPTNTTGTLTNNLITNPQFALVNFSNEYVLTNATNPQSIPFAPGWYLDLLGTGNVTIEQVPLNSVLANPTNAPFCIHLSLAGSWTSAILRQRFEQNGMNWQGSFLSNSITARIDGPSATVTGNLVNSNGQTICTVLGTTLTNAFVENIGNAFVPAYANPDVPPAAYIDYKLTIPATGDIYITSVQLLESDVGTNYEYEQDTINRQIDHTFNYYQSALNYKPTESYLVGWDFPMNPAQFGTTIPVNNTTTDNAGFYAWDQTILYQSVNNGVNGLRAPNGGLQLICNLTGQIGLIQYLGAREAQLILNGRNSVYISGFGTFSAGSLGGKVTLWATTDASLPTLPNTFVTAVNQFGTPTAFSSANWFQIPNVYQNNTFSLQAQSPTNSESADIYLNGWDVQGAIPNGVTFFAIFIGFEQWQTSPNDTMTINNIALCPGDIATRPAHKTYTDTLSECQSYYETSYSSPSFIGQVALIDALTITMGGQYTPTSNIIQMTVNSFTLNFKETKRVNNPTMSIYSASPSSSLGAPGYVLGILWYGSVAGATGSFDISLSPNWSPVTGRKGIYYNLVGFNYVGTTPTITPVSGSIPTSAIVFHYIADARFGIV